MRQKKRSNYQFFNDCNVEIESPIKFGAPHVLMHIPASTVVEVHGPVMHDR